MNRRQRIGNDLFKRKLVITVPPWGIPIIALALFGGIAIRISLVPPILVSTMSLIVTITALIAVMTARKQVRHIKYEAARAVTIMATDAEENAYETHLNRVPQKEILHVNNHATPSYTSLSER